MLPHQFKRLLEAFQQGFAALQEAVNKHADALTKEQASSRKGIQSTLGSLVSISDQLEIGNQRAQTASDQSSGQQERLIHLQGRVVFWAALTFFAAFGYGAVAYWQGWLMRRTYAEMQNQTKAARQSAYMSCLSAQAAQRTLTEIQKNARDSHAAAAASIEQTSAGIESERAYVHFTPRMPDLNDLFEQRLEIPFAVKNEGKSNAINMSLRADAIILGPKDKLSITDKNQKLIVTAKSVREEESYPPTPEQCHCKPITISLNVHGMNGEAVPLTSPAAQDFLTTHLSYIVAVYGKIRYSDFAGTHSATFCAPLFTMNAGTTHPTSSNEKTCAAYNREQNTYSSLPTIEGLLPTQEMKAVSCEAPKD